MSNSHATSRSSKNVFCGLKSYPWRQHNKRAIRSNSSSMRFHRSVMTQLRSREWLKAIYWTQWREAAQMLVLFLNSLCESQSCQHEANNKRTRLFLSSVIVISNRALRQWIAFFHPSTCPNTSNRTLWVRQGVGMPVSTTSTPTWSWTPQDPVRHSREYQRLLPQSEVNGKAKD